MHHCVNHSLCVAEGIYRNKHVAQILCELSQCVGNESVDSSKFLSKLHEIELQISTFLPADENAFSVLLCLLAGVPLISNCEEVCTKLFDLCKKANFSKQQLYAALVARTELNTLNTFLNHERPFLRDGAALIKSLMVTEGNVFMELFLVTVMKQQHWLLLLLDQLTHTTRKDDFESVKNLLSLPIFQSLWPVLFLETLKNQPDTDFAFLKLTAEHTMQWEECHSSVRELAKQTNWYLTVLLWIKENSTSFHISSDLNGLYCDTLTLFDKFCDLSSLAWSPTHDFLKKYNDEEGRVSKGDIELFDAFSACASAFEYILMNIQSRQLKLHQVDESESLGKVKIILSNIQPYSLRLKIMERIFSLLFLRYEDFHDDACSDSEEGEIDTNQSVHDDGHATNLSSNFLSSSLGSVSNTFEVDDGKTQELDRKPNANNYVETKIDSEPNLQKHGFVCDRFMTRNLLKLLQLCLNCESEFNDKYSMGEWTGNTTDASPPTEENSVERGWVSLKAKVSEALWRLEIVLGSDFVHDADKSVVKLEKLSVPDWLFQHCVDDDSASDDESFSGAVSNRGLRGIDAEKSSESESQSNLTSQGNGSNFKWSRKGRRKSSIRTYIKDTTVKRMLSSKQNLAAQCLIRGNFAAAEQVVQVLELEESSIGCEVAYVQALQSLRHKVNTCAMEKSIQLKSAPQLFSQNSTLQAIQRAASDGVQASSLNKEVEKLLSKRNLPRVIDVEHISKDYQQLFGGSSERHPVVTAAVDIVLIVSSSLLQAANFWNILANFSSEFQNVQAATTTSRSRTIGFLPVVHNILQVPVSATESVSPSELLHRWDIPSLVNRGFRDTLHFWETAMKLLEEFQTSTCKLSLLPKFLQLMASRGFDSKQDHQYLQEFKAYLKSLIDVANVSEDCFAALQWSPMKCIANMVLDRGTPPSSIEDAVSKLGCNLPHILSSELCSFLPSVPPAVPYFQSVGDPRPKDIQILNAFNFIGPVRHPLKVVELLLSSVCKELSRQLFMKRKLHVSGIGYLLASEIDTKQLQLILEGTWELRDLDLNILQPGAETLTFYCNLANLMWIHCLLQFSSAPNEYGGFSQSLDTDSSFQQLVALSSCAYQVGNAGILTLWEVRRLALGVHLMTPIGTKALQDYCFVTDSFDALALFVVSTGTLHSPRIKVLYPEDLEQQLQHAVTDYIQHWVVNGPGPMILPSLVHQYIKSTGQNMKTFLKDYVGEIQDSTEIAEESCFKCEEVPRVVVEYGDLSACMSHRSCATDLNDMSWKSNQNLCDSILQYINSKSPLVFLLLQELLREPAVLDDSCESVDEALEATEINITTDTHTPTFHQYPCLDRLCRRLSDSSLCQIFENNVLLCALHNVVPYKLLWKHLNLLATRKEWQTIVEVLDALPEAQLKSDSMLTIAQDIALLELLVEARGTLHPCLFYEKLNSLCLQAKCVITESRYWPGKVSLDQLSKVLQIEELRLYPALLTKAERLMLSIAVYQKVIDSSPSVPWKSWQDVQNASNHNPTDVLDQILCCENAELCLSWLQLHDIARSQPHLITSKVIVLLLNDLQDRFLDIERLLKSMPQEIAAEICCDAIVKLHKLSAYKFCVKFLSHDCLKELNVDARNMLEVVSLGIEMISEVPTTVQLECIELVSSPHLMIEQLIMNIQLEAAERMLSAVRNKLQTLRSKSALSIPALDSLFRQYAEKALEFRISQGSTASQTAETSVLLASMSSLSSKDSHVPPVVPTKAEWVPNEEASVCMNCKSAAFTMFNRRHHCRHCGKVVCAQCSPHKMLVEGYGDLRVRVCSSCYSQTMECELNPNSDQLTYVTSEGNNSLPPENVWRLSNCQTFNATVRGEFAFEHAPSVSLCLSILKLHSESAACPNFLVDSCETILSYLQPHAGIPNPEVDYAFVIEMCRSLVIAAKVKCAQWGYISDEPSCDQRLSKIDLLELLVSHGCAALIPSETSNHGLRRLQSQLLEAELWELALEVSTKSGMERIGVWSSWGKSCLRAGRLKEAREKFVYCFPSSSKINKSAPDSALLIDILQILEGSSHMPDEEADTSQHLSNRVLNTLASLKAISQGKFPQSQDQSSCRPLPPHIYAECCYYLKEYGSNLTYFQFLVRHADFQTILDHTLSCSIDPSTFFESVYMPCLRNGQITQLHSAMTAVDSSLGKWTIYLHGICAALERRKLLHTLYEVQQWSKDHVRAAMTCIRFYHLNAKSYLQLAANVIHLMRAQSHLEGALAVASASQKAGNDHVPSTDSSAQSSESMWLQLTQRELDHHINTVERQMELTKFLSAYEANGHTLYEAAKWFAHAFAEPLALGLPTLFGSTPERNLLASLCLFCGKNVEEGYGIVYRIIENFNLSGHEIYEAVGVALFKAGRVAEIPQLLNCIQESSVVSDSIILACVGTAPHQLNARDMDILARRISDPAVKIKVFIMCGQLKSAYLFAVKYERLDDIEVILKEAEKLGQEAIKKICLKRLGR